VRLRTTSEERWVRFGQRSARNLCLFVLRSLGIRGSQVEEGDSVISTEDGMPMQTRFVVDKGVKYLLFLSGLVALVVVFFIGYLTVRNGLPAFREIGLEAMFLGERWRPGQELYGLLPIIAGSLIVTFGAIVIGLPFALGAAVFLAEVAPDWMRDIVRPAVELLAGIPSVVYGLFGMVVLVPMLRRIKVPGNTGYNILSASIVLAVMILPTITNISEDAIRSVRREFKEGSLALGATHWQTIVGVILPAARSGIVAAIVLGIGRALGETMALTMVIGNSVMVPKPLTNSPLTVFLRQARTLTGNIAVEMNYATGVHESSLFATGVMLFVLIMGINSLAHALMKKRS